jgi:hypothetical protein
MGGCAEAAGAAKGRSMTGNAVSSGLCTYFGFQQFDEVFLFANTIPIFIRSVAADFRVRRTLLGKPPSALGMTHYQAPFNISLIAPS